VTKSLMRTLWALTACAFVTLAGAWAATTGELRLLIEVTGVGLIATAVIWSRKQRVLDRVFSAGTLGILFVLWLYVAFTG